MPDRDNEMVTSPGAAWTSVNGEFATVQTLPTVLLPQAAAVPTPAKIFCRSKFTSPLGTVNVANCGIGTAPVVGGPTRFFNVTAVAPENEPVSGA